MKNLRRLSIFFPSPYLYVVCELKASLLNSMTHHAYALKEKYLYIKAPKKADSRKGINTYVTVLTLGFYAIT